MDARALLESYPDSSFDVIITDLTEPAEGCPSQYLFSKEFFKICKKKLREKGNLAMQASILRVTTFEMHASIVRTLKEVFPIVRSYAAYVPAFDTTWGFAFASFFSDPIKVSQEEIDKKVKDRLTGNLRYYDGITHFHLFSLGKDIRELLEQNGQIITDEAPFRLKRKDQIFIF